MVLGWVPHRCGLLLLQAVCLPRNSRILLRECSVLEFVVVVHFGVEWLEGVTVNKEVIHYGS